MKKLLFSSAVVIVALSTASAADLSRPMYTKAPPPALKRAKKVLRSQRAQ